MASGASASFFRLAVVHGGRVYLLTGLGEFKSHAAAVDYYRSKERVSARSLVVETIPLIRHGVECGFREVRRNLDGTVMP